MHYRGSREPPIVMGAYFAENSAPDLRIAIHSELIFQPSFSELNFNLEQM